MPYPYPDEKKSVSVTSGVQWRRQPWAMPQPAPETPPAPGAPAYESTAISLPAGPASPDKPAMQQLMAVASGEKFRQDLLPEGWDVEQPPDLAVPGDRMLPPSSRALSQLASTRGRVY